MLAPVHSRLIVEMSIVPDPPENDMTRLKQKSRLFLAQDRRLESFREEMVRSDHRRGGSTLFFCLPRQERASQPLYSLP